MYIVERIFERAPEILGMELKRKRLQWWGGYRLDGSSHPRPDKLKVYMWNGHVCLHEEGGLTMTIEKWMVQYGGCGSVSEAVIRMNSGGVGYWQPRQCACDTEEAKFVGEDVFNGASAWSIDDNPFFRWMSSLFGAERTREVWKRYGVTVDPKGWVCFWYRNSKGRICHDKRVMFRSDGHRNKDMNANRRYKVGDGYTERCLFGEHLIKEGMDVCCVESEKSALICALRYPDRTWVATGGKCNLPMDVGTMTLYPDLDAVDDWCRRRPGAKMCDWWSDWTLDEMDRPHNADIADKIVWEKNIELNFGRI